MKTLILMAALFDPTLRHLVRNLAITFVALAGHGLATADELKFHGPLLQWHRDPVHSVTFSWVEQTSANTAAPVWRKGIAGFGYGDDDDRTQLPDMEDRYERVFLAATFPLQTVPRDGNLKLIIDYDDAFIAWINGVEVARSGNIKGQYTNAKIDSKHEAGEPEVFVIKNAGAILKAGVNLLAIEGHNNKSSSSDFSLDPVLLIGDDMVIGAGEQWAYLAGADPPRDWYRTAPVLQSNRAGRSGWSLGVRPRGSSAPLRMLSIQESQFGETEYPVYHAIIGSLQSGSEYEYVLATGSTRVKTGWFRTAPGTLTRPLTFVVGGDMDTEPAIAVSKLAGEIDPLFAMVGGDLAYANGKEVDRWFDWLDNWTRYLVGKGGREIPVIAAIGNHETKGIKTSRSNAPYYFSLFDSPTGRSNFTVDFASYMSIVVLDTDHAQKIDAQTSWLRGKLAARKNVPNLFAIYHEPAWGTGVKGNNAKVQDAWCPLFEQYGVDCVFENDHHTYKRSHKIIGGVPDPQRGVRYIGDGAWGRKLRPIRDSHLDRVGARGYLAKWASRHHLVKVTASPDGTKRYEAVSPEIGTFDTVND